MTSKQKSTPVTIRNVSRAAIKAIERMKLRNDTCSINFVTQRQVLAHNPKVVDALVDLLRTNHNIKSLNCNVGYESTASLFEALAAGKAGCNLESLQQLNVYLEDTDATVLGSYLTTNRNLKQLGISLYAGRELVQLVSSLACSTVVELELHVFHTHGCLRELGSKLGQCNLIVSLTIDIQYITKELDDDVKAFFADGLDKMRSLANLGIRLARARSPTILAFEDGFSEMIKSSSSITKADLTHNAGVKEPFRDEVKSYCILNRVFGTNLIGFDRTKLWTRVLAKIRDGSARATFLFRLLREKPELLIVGNVQFTCGSSHTPK